MPLPPTKHLNLSRLTGWEGGPCPRPSLNATTTKSTSQSQQSHRLGRRTLSPPNFECHSPTTKHLNLCNLTGWEGGPCPRPSLNATHQQLNISISVISQVGKVDPIPAQL